MFHSLVQHFILDSKMKYKRLKYSDIEQRDIALVQIVVWIRKKGPTKP
jgi:hypothetical protein